VAAFPAANAPCSPFRAMASVFKLVLVLPSTRCASDCDALHTFGRERLPLSSFPPHTLQALMPRAGRVHGRGALGATHRRPDSRRPARAPQAAAVSRAASPAPWTRRCRPPAAPRDQPRGGPRPAARDAAGQGPAQAGCGQLVFLELEAAAAHHPDSLSGAGAMHVGRHAPDLTSSAGGRGAGC
jgi:hypothetical protein